MLWQIPVEQWPEELGDMRQGFAGRLNVYGIMANHPSLLRAWSNFREHVVVKNVLGSQPSEVVILRTGVRMGSDYEWAHHVSRARKTGMSDTRIRSIRGPLNDMSEEDRVLCTAVDQLFDRKGLNNQTLEALVALVGVEGVLDVMATVTHYSLLGFMLNSSDTPLDADVAAELAAAPLA